MSAADETRPTHERLRPGEHCRISEAQWMDVLQRSTPLHQWGPAFLVDEGADGCVRAYLRDDSGAGRHTAFRFDASRSARARAGVAEIDAAESAAAEHVTDIQRRGMASLDETRAQDAASTRYVETAEALYRELLAIAPRGASPDARSS